MNKPCACCGEEKEKFSHKYCKACVVRIAETGPSLDALVRVAIVRAKLNAIKQGRDMQTLLRRDCTHCPYMTRISDTRIYCPFQVCAKEW